MISRLGIRSRLLLVVVLAVAVALAAMIVAFDLLLGASLSRNADEVLRARATSELDLLQPAPGGLAVGEAPDDAAPDTQVWVFSGRRLIEAPRTGSHLDAAARALVAGGRRFADVGSETRLYTVPAVFNGRRLGTVVAGVSLAPYNQTRRTALIASLVLGFAILLLGALGARWLLSSALRPVGRMTRQAAEWSEHDLDRRFGAGPPSDELTELAATLDGLLDRLAASLRREQRFSAELSHELRTPLARLLAETELALRRERTPDEYRHSLELVRRNAQQLSRTVDALVAAARHEAGGKRATADAGAVAAEAVEACAELAAERGIALSFEPSAQPLRLGLGSELAERILQPLIENGCRYARSRVTISVRRDGSRVLYVVEDDGPGVADEERERIFEPGVRGAAADGDDGAGLGLALARRLARSASGDVQAEPGAAGRFIVRLPAG